MRGGEVVVAESAPVVAAGLAKRFGAVVLSVIAQDVAIECSQTSSRALKASVGHVDFGSRRMSGFSNHSI